jgi:hypothetical protein
MEAQMLRPLQWFGLLEHQEEPTSESLLTNTHYYRKTALFDRFLTFDVRLETPGGSRH